MKKGYQIYKDTCMQQKKVEMTYSLQKKDMI